MNKRTSVFLARCYLNIPISQYLARAQLRFLETSGPKSRIQQEHFSYFLFFFFFNDLNYIQFALSRSLALSLSSCADRESLSVDTPTDRSVQSRRANPIHLISSHLISSYGSTRSERQTRRILILVLMKILSRAQAAHWPPLVQITYAIPLARPLLVLVAAQNNHSTGGLMRAAPSCTRSRLDSSASSASSN